MWSHNPTDTCGDCALCCKLLHIEADLDANFPEKPWNTWCHHAKPGALPGACTIYATRPPACQVFQCIYIQSHSRSDVPSFAPVFKPNKSHVVLMPSLDPNTPDLIFAHCDPAYPRAWRQEPMRSYLIQVTNHGGTVIVVLGTRRFIMTQGRPTIELTEGQIAELSKGVYAKATPQGGVQIGYDPNVADRRLETIANVTKQQLDKLHDTTLAGKDGRFVPRRVPLDQQPLPDEGQE